MSRIVIICASYGEIKWSLYLATHDYRDHPITIVILGHHDLFKFLQAMNERVFHDTLNLIYLEPYQAGRVKAKGVKKVCHVFPDILKERRYLKEIFDRYFAQVEGCEVFFQSRGFNGYIFYLVKKLSERNRLVNISPSPPQIAPVTKYTPTNIVDLASLIILKLIYGWDIALGRLPHVKGFPYMSDKFIEKKVDRVIGWEEMGEMMKGFDLNQFRVFDVGNYSVIYFDDSSLEAGYITDKDVYQTELTGIFNTLAKYFPEKEIARKYHPGYPDDKTMIKIGDVLPDFIPAELLYNDNVKMYLSLFSYSIANVKKGLAVSLGDLITLKDEKTKKQLKEVLVKMSKSKVLFPKSLDEFEEILIDLKGQMT